jgi:rRNA-processing protein FCF1
MSKVAAFLDTNIFLHYQPFDQINWLKELDAEEVELFIAPIVIRELDDHKDHHRLSSIRNRARATLKKIEALITGLEIVNMPEGVNVFYLDEPSLSFEEYGLRNDVSDDHLIASCIEHACSEADRRIVIVTDDTGPRLKARKHSIAAVSLDDRLKLPSALDENEKKTQHLHRKIQQLESSLPNLNLGFSDGSQNLFIKIPEPYEIDVNKIKEKIIDIQRRYPKLYPESNQPANSDSSILQNQLSQISLSKAMLACLTKPSQEEYERYNSELNQFYENYKEYLNWLTDYKNIESRTIEIEVVLFNRGKAPAEDIDVFMHFPDGLLLLGKEELPETLDSPQPPRKPMSRAELMNSLTLPTSSLYSPHISSHFSMADTNISLPSIKKTNSYNVNYSVGKLKQHMDAPCDKFFVYFENLEDAKSFGIDYRINAANIPHEIEGKLNVMLN